MFRVIARNNAYKLLVGYWQVRLVLLLRCGVVTEMLRALW